MRGMFMGCVMAIPISFMIGLPLRFMFYGEPPRDATAQSIFAPLIGIWLIVSAILAVGAVIWANLAVRRYSFEVADDEVVVRKGIVFRTTTRIPMRKIQDIHVRQGPILRALGLASIKLDTAGGFTPSRGMGPGFMAEGQLPGIRNAEQVAAALSARVKELRSDL